MAKNVLVWIDKGTVLSYIYTCQFLYNVTETYDNNLQKRGRIMSKELIRLRDLTMEFDGERILDGINLYINDHEFLTLLGPSGCGKTTTLRIIGGFLNATSGTVTFDGKVINDAADLAMYLLEEGHVACVGGGAFGSPECIRMSYATSDENLVNAFTRIKNALAVLK